MLAGAAALTASSSSARRSISSNRLRLADKSVTICCTLARQRKKNKNKKVIIRLDYEVCVYKREEEDIGNRFVLRRYQEEAL
jgi:hypothetical protein